MTRDNRCGGGSITGFVSMHITIARDIRLAQQQAETDAHSAQEGGGQKGNGPVGWEQEVGGGKAREQPATTPTHNRAPCGVQCCGSCWTHCLPRPPTEKNTGEKRKGHRMGCEKSGKGKESAMWFARIAPDKTMATSLPRGQKGMEEGSRNPNPNPNSPACALRPRPSRLPCWRARRRRSGG